VVDAALLINATNTASGAASKLIDAQIGGTSQFSVDKAGNTVQLGSVTATGGISAGTSPPSVTAGTGGVDAYGEGTVPSACAATSVDCVYASSTQHGLLASFNNGSYLPLTQGPASATTGNLPSFNGTNGGLFQDSGVLASNVVTDAGTATAHGVMVGAGTKTVTVTAVGATDKVFVGATGADPVWSKVTLTNPATAATITVLDNKVFTVNNTITLAGTDAQTYTFPSTSATIARTDAGQSFTGTNSFGALSNFGAITVTSITALTNATTPNAAGGTTIGSASLPFSSYYVGGAATNNFQITGTATAARVMTLPDVTSATFVVAGTSTTATQALFATSTAGAPAYRAISATDLPATPLVTPGTTPTLTGPRGYAVCTGTCTVSVPVPAAGYEFCVMNDDNVTTAITLSALGSSAMYENSARTAYGTAGTGTLVVAAAAKNKVCIVGRDATHYLTVSNDGGAITVN
jgi:hypothetical protein